MGRVGPRVRVPHELTSREEEVLALVRVGLTNEEIGERLGISANGVKYHVSEILSKLGVESREEAAAWRPERRWWSAVGPLTLAKAAGVALAVAALVGLGVLAWSVAKGGGGSAGDEAVCAGGSTERFEEAEEWAWFDVYCPGYLPPEFSFDVLKENGGEKTAGGETPNPQGGSFNAVFVDGSGSIIQFLEGNLGNDLFPLWREYPPPEAADVRYGQRFDALFYAAYEAGENGMQPAVVWAQDTGLAQYVILSKSMDDETLRAIAEGMVRVGGGASPSVADPAACRRELENVDKGGDLPVAVVDGIGCWEEVSGASSYNASVDMEGYDCETWLAGATPLTSEMNREVQAGTTWVELPTDAGEPRFIQVDVSALDAGGETVATGAIALTLETDYVALCGAPFGDATSGDFPEDFLQFAESLDAALSAGSDGQADVVANGFFGINTVYGKWACGGSAFPAPGPNCVETSDGSGTPAVVIGLQESEGGVYDRASYEQFLSDWMANVDPGGFDDYGKPLARVEAVADLRPEIEGQAEGEEVYSVIATRIADDSGSPPGLAGRQVLIFFAEKGPGGWLITGLLRALPPFIDPGGDWPVYPDVSDLIISWRRLVAFGPTPTPTVVSVVTGTATPTPPGATAAPATPTPTRVPPFGTSIAVVDVSSGAVDVVASYGLYPSWSPNGQLAYIGDSSPPGFAGWHDYFVSNADGSGRKKISRGTWTDAVTCPWSRTPAWSANGQWVAHDSAEPDTVVAVQASGGGSFEASGCRSRWSKTGTRIAFVDSWLGDSNIVVADVESGATETITEGVSPEWSPDDKWIAFVRGRELWVRDLSSGDERLVTTFDRNYEDQLLRWSPSGETILVDDGSMTLVDVETGSKSSAGEGWRATWSPDGSHLAFSRWPADGGPSIYVLDLDSSEERLITAGDRAAWSPDGSRIVLERPID